MDLNENYEGARGFEGGILQILLLSTKVSSYWLGNFYTLLQREPCQERIDVWRTKGKTSASKAARLILPPCHDLVAGHWPVGAECEWGCAPNPHKGNLW